MKQEMAVLGVLGQSGSAGGDSPVTGPGLIGYMTSADST